jgi:CDP-diacylglycerol--glycerol-3-phosphate 3-phosphatidyltransferase
VAVDTGESRNEWLRKLPNKLTIGRIAAIPLLLILYPLDVSAINVFCALVFAVACITDFFDGYLARKYNSVTPLGALLDPIADKMLVAAALLLLAHAKIVFPLLAGILICRDIAVSGIRLVALEQNFKIEVNDFGKWKTGVTGLAITCLLVGKPLFDLPMHTIGMVTLYIALGLSLFSGWMYCTSFMEKTKESLNL